MADMARMVRRAGIGRVALHVVLPLAIGVLCYAAWRSKDIQVVAWMSRIAPRGVDAMQGAASSRVPSVILGSLPDAAWAWAFGASLMIVWHGRPWREKAAWLGGGATLAIAAELGQAFHVVPGTFDVADLVAIAAGFVLGAALAGRGRATERS